MALKVEELMVSLIPEALRQLELGVATRLDCDNTGCGVTGCDGTNCGATGCTSTGCGMTGCGGTGCGSTGCGQTACGSTGCTSTGCGTTGCGSTGCGTTGCGLTGGTINPGCGDQVFDPNILVYPAELELLRAQLAGLANLVKVSRTTTTKTKSKDGAGKQKDKSISVEDIITLEKSLHEAIKTFYKSIST